ncbi:hypothetical protein ACVWY3_003921 [Bradyrhizobium sp. USDA 4486]
MRTVDAPRDPLLHQEALQVCGVVAQVDRRQLERDRLLGLGVDGQINVAAAAAMNLPDNPVTVDYRTWLRQRRKRQLRGLIEDA